jgi:hypothetical protein
MIAYLTARYLKAGVSVPKIEIYSRWPVEELKGYYGV